MMLMLAQRAARRRVGLLGLLALLAVAAATVLYPPPPSFGWRSAARPRPHAQSA